MAGIFSIKSINNYKNSSHYKIGIINVIDHPALNETVNGVQDTLKIDNIKILYEVAQGDTSLAHQIIQKFLQQNVNIIVTIGTTVTQVAVQKTKNIPIVFASVTSPQDSGILQNNVTGVSNFSHEMTTKQLEFFQKLLPNLKTIGIIYNSGESNSVTSLQRIKSETARLNIQIKEIVAQNTNEAVFAVKPLIGSVDAIFIDNDNTALAAIKGIVDTAMKAKIPVFCSDVDTVKLGVFAAVGPNQYDIGVKAAEMALKILHDKKTPNEIPVIDATSVKYEYVVNETSAQNLNISLPSNSGIRIEK